MQTSVIISYYKTPVFIPPLYILITTSWPPSFFLSLCYSLLLIISNSYFYEIDSMSATNHEKRICSVIFFCVWTISVDWMAFDFARNINDNIVFLSWLSNILLCICSTLSLFGNRDLAWFYIFVILIGSIRHTNTGYLFWYAAFIFWIYIH